MPSFHERGSNQHDGSQAIREITQTKFTILNKQNQKQTENKLSAHRKYVCHQSQRRTKRG